MSIERLMHHKAQVWRPTESQGADGEVVDTFALVTDPTSNNAEPWVMDRVLRDAGPGEQLVGNRHWVLRRDASPQKFDVLRITAGNMAPSRYRVLDVFPAGNGTLHHYEALTEPWEGLLPVDASDEESSS